MKLLFLGGGGCQLNSILRAKAWGHEVILCDYLSDCVGKPYADVFAQVSTFDVEGVIVVTEREDVDGFVCIGTDQPVLTAAMAAEKLGKRFYLNVAQAKCFTNKMVMKKIFTKYGIPNVPYAFVGKCFEDEDLAGLRFPVVVKPVDSQGQRGVLMLNSVDEIRERLNEVLSFSREEKILVEEYYQNDEVTYNGWVVDGELFTLSIVDRVTFEKEAHLGICLAHNFPSFHYAKYGDEIERMARKIVQVTGIQNGPVYFQFLIGEEGVRVNEVAARIGGAYEDITIPILAGIDILDLLFKQIAGEEVDVTQLREHSMKDVKVHISSQLFFVRQGLISWQTPIDVLEKNDFIEKVGYHKFIGTVIEDTKDATNRAGFMIIRGNSKDEMLSNVEKAFDLMRIEDENGDNMVIRYSDYQDKYKMLNEEEY